MDYIVKDGEVVIVDEFTGRLMPGRRFSEGLHQALEAKENVKVASENQTLATITFQNYFRMYEKLAGMTGTADTEAAEFSKIYNLDVVVIPTHKPMVRKDHGDQIYRTEREKFDAVVNEIKERHKKGQPILVGTISIDNSEKLSKLLKRSGVQHTVLNAKHHAKEAEIVSQAGQPGRGDHFPPTWPDAAPTSSWARACPSLAACTSSAPSGTNPGASTTSSADVRAARGDNGSSRFYVSLEDDLMRLFGSERISGIMAKLGMEEGEPIEHGPDHQGH